MLKEFAFYSFNPLQTCTRTERRHDSGARTGLDWQAATSNRVKKARPEAWSGPMAARRRRRLRVGSGSGSFMFREKGALLRCSAAESLRLLLSRAAAPSVTQVSGRLFVCVARALRSSSPVAHRNSPNEFFVYLRQAEGHPLLKALKQEVQGCDSGLCGSC